MRADDRHDQLLRRCLGAVGGHRRGTVVFTPLALALAIGGGFYARANAPRGIVAPFVALAIANLLLLVVVGLSLTVSGGGSSSWG